MTTAMKFDEDWAQKFYSNNKIDLNLQVPTENESIKIEVADAPTDATSDSSYFTKITATSAKSTDSYLQSILSSSPKNSSTTGSCNGSESCACYKCQRQRRRAGINATTTTTNTKTVANPYTPLKKIENSTSNQPTEQKAPFSSSSPSLKKQTSMAPSITPIVPPTPVATPPTTPSSVSPKSTIVHKQPTVSTSPPKKQHPSVSVSPVSISSIPTPPASTSPVSPKSTSTQQSKRSNTLRKTPTLKSYEKHMPKPAYSQEDSIYRFDDSRGENRHTEAKKDLNDILEEKDNYKVSWREEGTGDDLLTSLVTFQTIFEEKGNENEGLSDLLEQKAKELKYQKIRERQDALSPKKQDDLPPRRSDCLTLSYRQGPKHHALTLFHTMKLKNEKERKQAYNMAFQHCINADSGLKSWVKKQRTPPARESSKLIQAVRKPTVKRSLLHPLASRKNKMANDEFLLWSTSSDNLGMMNRNTSKRSFEMISAPIQAQNNDEMIDVISVAHALLPNQQFAANVTPAHNKIPYEHIDTPSKPRQGLPSPGSINEFRDTSSISSAESANGTSSSYGSSKLIKGRPGRLFSSLGRKASMKSSKSNRDVSTK